MGTSVDLCPGEPQSRQSPKAAQTPVCVNGTSPEGGGSARGPLHSPQPMRMYHQMYLLSEVKVSSSRVCRYMPSTSSQ